MKGERISLENYIDLTPYGLTKNQSHLYQVWLQVGMRSVSALARHTGMHRVLCYSTLKELCSQWICTHMDIWKTWYYTMVPPYILQEKLQNKVTSFSTIIPLLQTPSLHISWAFVAQEYKWIEALKSLYDLVPNSSTDLKLFLWADHIEAEFREYLYNVYLPKRIAKGLHAKAIVPSTAANRRYANTKTVAQTEVLLIPDELFNLNSEIILFDTSKILIACMSPTEMSWLLIQSKNLYSSLEHIFDLLRRSHRQ